jgi:hypothetical protein
MLPSPAEVFPDFLDTERTINMRSLRHGTAALIAAIGLLAGPALGAIQTAHATTGPSANFPKTFKVKSAFAAKFVGEYTLKSISAPARIKSAALGIEVNSNGFLYGIGQFYGYDGSGSQISWVTTLYHFKQVGTSNEMQFDLLSSSLTIVLGHMSASAPSHGRLTGSIVLDGHSYPIVFNQISKR